MGAEDLIQWILTSKEIPEVTLYDFNLQNMTALPKHVIFPDNKEDRNRNI